MNSGRAKTDIRSKGNGCREIVVRGMSAISQERPQWGDIVEKVRVAASHGMCIEWRSSKTLKMNPDSLRSAAMERDSMVGADFSVRRTFSTISGQTGHHAVVADVLTNIVGWQDFRRRSYVCQPPFVDGVED